MAYKKDDEEKIVHHNDIENMPLGNRDDSTNEVWSIPWFTGPRVNMETSIFNIPVSYWVCTCVFSATDYDTVAWTSGSIYLFNNLVLAISAGNTGNISWVNYVYLDKNISLTTLQVTSNPALTMWFNRILVCIVKSNTNPTPASFRPLGSI